MNFQSAASNSKGGKFRIEAQTTNNPLMLNNEQLPIDATLTVDARNTNSPVRVHLAPAYEGTFSLATTNQGAYVQQVSDIDPAHRSRKRTVFVNSVGKKTTGYAAWSKDGRQQGHGAVSIASTNSPVNLFV